MKLFGGCIIVAACFFVGMRMSAAEDSRLKAVDSLISLFHTLRFRIESERAPLAEIFASIEDKYLSDTGFTKALRCRTGSVAESWEAAIRLLPLPEETVRELCIFGRELGHLPLQTQLARIDSCSGYLASLRSSIASGLQGRKKCYRMVSILIGLLISILLV